MKTPVVILLALFATASYAAIPPARVAEFPEGERILYTQIVDAYHRNQLADLVKKRQVLERNYPLSVHLDNAYFLSGKLEFQQNHFAEALKDFDVVRDRYAKSIRRPSALFGIGMTFEKLNLMPQAHRVFASIMKEYPGSPEAQRAWMTLRLEKEGPKQKVKR